MQSATCRSSGDSAGGQSSKRKVGDCVSSSSSSDAPSTGRARVVCPELSGVLSGDGLNFVQAVVTPGHSQQSAAAQLSQRFAGACPFPYLQLEGMFDREFLQGVRKDLAAVDFNVRSTDTRDLFETPPLDTAGFPDSVKRLQAALRSSDMIQFLSLATGLALEAVPMGDDSDALATRASIFRRGGYETCSSGLLPGSPASQDGSLQQVIAFTLHLADENWTPSDGGSIELLNSRPSQSETTRTPAQVVTRLVPAFNSFVLVQLGRDSFHQVEEVHGKLPRLAVRGWYLCNVASARCETQMQHSRHYLTSMQLEGPSGWLLPQVHAADSRVLAAGAAPSAGKSEDSSTLEKWINAQHLQPEAIKAAGKKLEVESYVEFADFLRPEVFQQLRHGILHYKAAGLVGPHGRANYLCITGDVVRDFLRFLVSEPFKGYLNQLSELEFMDSRNAALGEQEPQQGQRQAFAEARRFEHGHYTLADPEARGFPYLEASLSLITTDERPAWIKSKCGYTCVTCDEGELLTVDPCENWFALCYCDPGASSYVKRLSVAAPGPLHDVRAQYPVKEDESHGGDSCDGSGEQSETAE